MFTSIMLAVAVTLAAPAPKEAKAEPGKIEGNWISEKYIRGGQEEPKRAGMQMSFADGKVTVKEEGGDVGYTADPKSNPAKIDIAAGKESIPGIYKIEGDTLTICFAKGGAGERPTKFESPDGSSIVLIILKREKK